MQDGQLVRLPNLRFVTIDMLRQAEPGALPAATQSMVVDANTLFMVLRPSDGDVMIGITGAPGNTESMQVRCSELVLDPATANSLNSEQLKLRGKVRKGAAGARGAKAMAHYEAQQRANYARHGHEYLTRVFQSHLSLFAGAQAPAAFQGKWNGNLYDLHVRTDGYGHKHVFGAQANTSVGPLLFHLKTVPGSAILLAKQRLVFFADPGALFAFDDIVLDRGFFKCFSPAILPVKDDVLLACSGEALLETMQWLSRTPIGKWAKQPLHECLTRLGLADDDLPQEDGKSTAIPRRRTASKASASDEEEAHSTDDDDDDDDDDDEDEGDCEMDADTEDEDSDDADLNPRHNKRRRSESDAKPGPLAEAEAADEHDHEDEPTPKRARLNDNDGPDVPDEEFTVAPAGEVGQEEEEEAVEADPEHIPSVEDSGDGSDASFTVANLQ